MRQLSASYFLVSEEIQFLIIRMEGLMTAFTRKILFFLLAGIMLIDFYLIFNAGNPDSFLRILIKKTEYDISITIGLSILIVLISFSMIRNNDQNSIKNILVKNSQYIIQLKNQNRSDEEIADSFLKEFGAEKGLFNVLLKRRVQRYISKIS